MNSKKMEAIELLRFPLALLVVVIHFGGSTIENQSHLGFLWFLNTDIVGFCSTILSVVATYAVPAFFFISGYLFFLKYENTIDGYKAKIKSRLWTLIIPYILWNILRTIFEFFKAKNGNIDGHGFLFNLFDIFICPANGQFWFIRDLIIMSFAAPLIYIAVSKTKLLLPIISFILVGLQIWPLKIHEGFVISSLLYFSLGAYFSINKYRIDDLFANYTKVSIALLLICVLIKSVCYFEVDSKWMTLILLMLSVPGLFNLTNFYPQRIKLLLTNLAPTSFFIFASHKIIGEVVGGGIKYVHLDTYIGNYIYFVRLIAIIALCICVYYALRKFMPITFKILTGNRK